MEAARCPKCAGTRVRRASSAWRHALRAAIGSSKRYCRDCGEKWHQTGVHIETSGRPVSETDIILLASVFALLFIAVTNFLRDKSFDMQGLVRSYYDEKYGAESQQRLWSDWGWLYGSRDQAQQDYLDHPKN